MKRKYLLTAILTSVFALNATNPKIIAHRGYWRADGSAQNSISSLQKADSIGCYASEFDVWMTFDSVLVVNHDPSINGVVIETSNSDIVLSQKLPNGENVPTLDSYFAEAEKLPVRLVCELKPHNSRSTEKAAVKEILRLAEEHGLTDRIDYITFSKDGFDNLIKLSSPSNGVYFLNGDYTPQQINYKKGAGIDYNLGTMKKHPEWIDECHEMGLLVNVWTVDKEEDMQWCIDNGVDFITTNEPELLQAILNHDIVR